MPRRQTVPPDYSRQIEILNRLVRVIQADRRVDPTDFEAVRRHIAGLTGILNRAHLRDSARITAP